jgi:hypothetical protein
MLVERDHEQRLVPVRAVAQRLVDVEKKLLALPHMRGRERFSSIRKTIFFTWGMNDSDNVDTPFRRGVAPR